VTAAILDHLWQSTLVAILAYVLTLLFRNNSASVRYWLWFAASVKFLLPFSLLAALGGMAFVHQVPPGSMTVLTEIQPAAAPFSAAPLVVAPVPGHSAWLGFLVAIWLLGLVSLAAFWLVRWCRLLKIVHSAMPLALDVPVSVKTTHVLLEPGLVGIWRPVILLPAGLASQLSRTEIDAILAHELSHLHRRDNLLAMAHMLVEAIFWFHPLVWFIGARLMEEREHACDERVLATGRCPLEYAQAILTVCRLYFRSPLVCASGVSGADLERRITAILANRDSPEMDMAGKFLLASLGILIVMAPLVAGGLKSAPAAQIAQRLVSVFLPLEPTESRSGNQAAESVLSSSTAAQAPTRHRQHLLAARYAVKYPAGGATVTAPAIEASWPALIVSFPKIATDSSPVAQSSGEADVTICRPPQQLPGTRLMGPRVCLPQHEWDQMKKSGVLLLPDGRSRTTSYDRQRMLYPVDCQSFQGSGTSSMIGLSTCPR
jgi:beta-lactamase regulating signal transducer with metallopeptidase domain